MPTAQIAITPAVQAFADQCRTLGYEDIYELFENESSPELQSAIYKHSDANTPEPVRSALNNLGERLQIRSLQDY